MRFRSSLVWVLDLHLSQFLQGDVVAFWGVNVYSNAPLLTSEACYFEIFEHGYCTYLLPGTRNKHELIFPCVLSESSIPIPWHDSTVRHIDTHSFCISLFYNETLMSFKSMCLK